MYFLCVFAAARLRSCHIPQSVELKQLSRLLYSSSSLDQNLHHSLRGLREERNQHKTDKDEQFPSADRPLTNQARRQFLTTDEKTIVCVHPAKPVEFKDTKVLHSAISSFIL